MTMAFNVIEVVYFRYKNKLTAIVVSLVLVLGSFQEYHVCFDYSLAKCNPTNRKKKKINAKS